MDTSKFTSYRNKVVNYVSGNQLGSNLVYPYDKGYHRVMKCDKPWVESRLRLMNGLKKTKSDIIMNKYAVRQLFMGQELLIYNQNGNYYLIEKDKKPNVQDIADKF